MRTVLYKKLLYAFSYVVVALFIEFITFNVMGLGAFPEQIRFDLLFIGIIAMFIFIIPSFRVEAVFIILLLVIQSALSFVNEAMYDDSMLRTVFTLDQLTAATSVAGVFTNDYVSWPFLIGLILIVLSEILFLLYLRRIKVKSQLKVKVQVGFFMAFLFTLTVFGSSYGLAYDKLYSPDKTSNDLYLLTDDKKLFSDTDYSLKLKAYKRFGTFAFYYKNLVNTLEGPTDIKGTLEDINFEYSQGEMSTKTPFTGAYKDNNLIMVMLESAEWYGITPELTPTLYALKQQSISSDLYLSKNKTNQSEAISIIGSYPSTTDIQAELESDVKNGLNSYPFALPSVFKRDGYTTTYMHNNTLEFYNRLKTHGAFGFDNLYFYETVELEHQYKTTDDFYDLESDYEFFKAVSKNYSYINPQGENPFMSFFTTLSMHGNYDDLNNFIKENDLSWDWDYTTATADEREEFEEDTPATNDFLCRYYDKITKQDFLNKFGSNIERLDLSDKEIHTSYLRYKQYQAAYMDLDAGVNELLQDLKQKGQLENTTILLFADHDGYYHNQNYTLRGYDKSEYYNLDLYSVPFMLYDGSMDLSISAGVNSQGEEYYPAFSYTSQIEPKIKVENSNYLVKDGERTKINRWFSTYDFVPTLLDLFGYQYNTNLYHGISVFNETSQESDRSVFNSFESGVYNNNFFMGGDGYIFHTKDGVVYRIDEDKDVLYWTEELGTDNDFSKAVSMQETHPYYEQLMSMLDIFVNKQYNNYGFKQDIYESVYDLKFFSYKGKENPEGEVLYEYADINKSIKKFEN